jgi:hypothetical protein
MISMKRPWLVGTLLPTAQQLQGTRVPACGTHVPADAARVAADVTFAVLGAPPPRGAPV